MKKELLKKLSCNVARSETNVTLNDMEHASLLDVLNELDGVSWELDVLQKTYDNAVRHDNDTDGNWISEVQLTDLEVQNLKNC